FDKSAELRSPIVICAGDNLPREVRVTLPAASVDWDSTSYGVLDLGPRGFCIIDADPAADIRLESPKRESQDEVPHERARVNPRSRVPLCQHVTKGIPQGEVGATPKAIVKEVSLNRRTNHACEKDVTEFDPAEKADIIFRV